MAGMLLIGILVGASIPVPSVLADSPGVDSSDSAGTGSINSTDAVEGMNVTSMRDTQDTKDSTATDQDSRNPIDDKDEVDIEIDGDSNSFDNNSIQIIYNNGSSTGDSDDSGESSDSDDSVFGDSSTDSDDFDDSDDSVFGDSSTDSDNFNDSDDFNESDDSVFNNSSAERFDDTINESNDSDSEDAFSVGSSSTVNDSNVADLQLNKTVNYDRISTGNHTSENVTVQFTIQVTNTGPAEATGIMIEDDSLTRTLTDESGFLYLSNTQSQGNYIPSNGTWSVGALETGETATLTVEAAVVGANETLTNTAEITVSDQFDPDSTLDNSDSAEDDQDSASVTIIGSVRKPVFKSLTTLIRVSG